MLWGYPQPADRMILVGDLFNRGPRPAAVLEMILGFRRAAQPGACRLECVGGNHDLDLLASIRALKNGASKKSPMDDADRATWDAVKAAGLRRELVALLEEMEMVHSIRDEAGRWAVVHGGVDPKLGLDRTPPEVKRTIRSRKGEVPWYDRYDGRDGLILCGHERQPEVLIRRRDGEPVVMNLDTSCCYGVALTAYIIEEDRCISVPAARPYYRPGR